MNEDFLHFIWQHRLYQPKLVTTTNQAIEVIHPGTKNTDGGPDFFNAKIKVGETLWVGNVEIHKDESEWFLHNHHKDASYNNVILHVVLNRSKETINARQRLVPVCELKFNQKLQQKYQQLYFNEQWIACQHEISKLDSFTLDQWFNRILIEKFESKSQLINNLLKETQNDWDQIFLILLARSFGFGLNGLPFELMARQTPLTVLLKHSSNLFQIEALLFGQAGFLNSDYPNDNYANDLKKEYEFLKIKYSLKPIEEHLWKFLRLRPVNFPTIRIAQLAQLIHQLKGQFASIQNINSQESLVKKLSVKTSEYWESHYKLGKTSSKPSIKKLGKQSCLRIIYNSIIPYLFNYASKHSDETQKEKIIDYLYQQPAEANQIINKWQQAGIECKNEAIAQALIFLKKEYCDRKKCLSCHVGHKVLCKI